MGVQFAGNILVQSNGGPLPISAGGTGQISAPLAINALLPVQTGNTGKFLTTNGTNVSWSLSAGQPAGADTQIQFNDAGSFGASSNFTINKTSGNLVATGDITAHRLNINGDAGTNRDIAFQTAGSDRWIMLAGSEAETGANQGSNFALLSLADNGLTYNIAYSVDRATRVVDFTQAPTINGVQIATGSITIGSTSLALGGSTTTLAGLTSVTSTSFVGALTGNASTATAVAGGAANQLVYQTGAGATSFATTANYGVVTTGATGTPAVIAGATGVLVGSTSATPSWSTAPTLFGANISGTAPSLTIGGNAATATTLATARTINGTSFNGSADITVTAAAGTLTGATLASGVTSSSLTSVGTLTSLAVTGTATAATFSGAGTSLTGTAAALSIGGTAATATAVAGGAANQVVYQTGAGTTSFATAADYGVIVTGATGTPAALAGVAGVLQGSASAVPAFTLTPTLTGTNFSGTAAALSIGGNAATATLATSATTATTATTLAVGRTLSVSTDATGTSAAFDGSGNATIPLTLATVNAAPQTDTFRKITVNGKGLTTATSAVSSSDITTALGYTPVNNAGGTMTGLLILSGDPVNVMGAVTKQYADGISSGINIHAACEVATVAPLAACTYNNGTGGVGATLTANANAPLGTVGGYAGLAVNGRILVKDQVAGLQNGIYTVTDLGSAGTPWILTRATDFDGSPTSECEAGDMTFIQEGTNGGTQWVETAIGTGHSVSPAYDYIIIGTDAMVFAQFAGSGTYTAGAGINLAANVISNTGVLSNVAGTGISVSGATGNVTVTNTGVTSVAGTTNQITASASTGGVTLSLPSAVTIAGAMTAGSFSGAGTGLTGTAASLSIGGTSASSTTATTATNIAGGLAGNIHYQSGVGATSLLATGTSSQVLVSGTTPSWTNAPTLTGTNFSGIPNGALTNNAITIGATPISLGAGNTTITGLVSVSSTTFVGALTGNASTATSLAGGTGGGIHYQVSSGNSGITAAGTTGQVLTSNGTGAPTWAASPAFTGGTVANATTFTSASPQITLGVMGTTPVHGIITGAVASGGSQNGSNITIIAGSAGAGIPGSAFVTGASSGTGTAAGNVTIAGGQNDWTGNGGSATLISGSAAGGGTGGNVVITAASGFTAGGAIVLTTSATTTPTERLRILANGAWSVGTGGTATGTAGQVLTSAGSAAVPTWTSVPTSIVGTANQITASAATGTVTLSLPSAVTISGLMTASSFNATSTKRVKKAVKNLSKSYLDNFSKLKPREYDRKDFVAHEFGFIAEEMELVYPEVVGHDAEGKASGIDYGKLSTILTAKVQEQQTTIDKLTTQVATIMEMLKGLK